MEYGIKPVSLGKRVLRTETAGMALMSMIMLTYECQCDEEISDYFGGRNGSIFG